MSQVLDHLHYRDSHEWIDSATGTVGITDHAQETLGDLVFIQLPEVGTEVSAGTQVAVIESVKTASDVFAPMSGKIIALNEAAKDAPETINENAYSAWLFKIQPSNPAEYDSLMSAEAYLAAN